LSFDEQVGHYPTSISKPSKFIPPDIIIPLIHVKTNVNEGYYGGEAGIGCAQASLRFGFRKVLSSESLTVIIIGPDHEKQNVIEAYYGGEAGIRTLGTGNPAQRFSRPPLSTAQAPLLMYLYKYQ
jgi:hypothetical protein